MSVVKHSIGYISSLFSDVLFTETVAWKWIAADQVLPYTVNILFVLKTFYKALVKNIWNFIETTTDQSELERQTKALQEELRRKRLKVENLRKLKRKEEMKAKEDCLKKQIEVIETLYL